LGSIFDAVCYLKETPGQGEANFVLRTVTTPSTAAMRPAVPFIRHAHARGPQERAWARVRGRALMKAALIAERRPSLSTLIAYGRRCRDPLGLPFVAAAALPGGRRAALAIR